MPPDDPFADIGDAPPPLDADRPAYRPRPPSPLRRAVVFGAVGGTLFALVVLPVLIFVFDVNPFRNPNVWREEHFANRAGGPCVLFSTVNVGRDEVRTLAAWLAADEDFGGPAGAHAVLDRADGRYVVSFFVDTRLLAEHGEEVKAAFRIKAAAISAALDGAPVTIQLCERTLGLRNGQNALRILERVE